MPQKPHPHKPPVEPPLPVPLPVVPFAYEPATALMTWNEGSATITGNLAEFNASAIKSAVWNITLRGKGLTKLTVGNNLPGLLRLDCANNQIGGELNTGGCPLLRQLFAFNNRLTSLNVSRSVRLETLSFYMNQVSVPPDIAPLLELVHYDGSENPFPVGTFLQTYHNPKLVNFHAYTTGVSKIDIANNPLVRDLDFGVTPQPPAVVGDTLHKLAAFGLSNGAFLFFNTSVPPPSAAGDIALLRQRGWELQLDGQPI